ncbi:MAG: MBL fold metallo-hydrolase [Lachnospiraceae bacterium]|nr:MBL fold metallo-hydrolase [Lachnospiraceae bacterium]
MKITYIYHSGFALELKHCILLFDYYKGSLPDWDKRKKLYVFASHSHSDHFSLKTLNLLHQYDRLHFFFSNDIRLSERYLERNHIPVEVKEKITFMGKNKTLVWDDGEGEEIRIQTLRSTDEGVAFLVWAEGKCIYHAGDLNWWHWEGESAAFNGNMARDYQKEIDKIEGQHFDVAFVPLDHRLEAAYGWGMDYFLSHTKTDYVFPMHMWDQYGVIHQYKKTPLGNQYQDKIMEIQQPGQEILL